MRELDLGLLESWAASKGTRPTLRLCRASGWTTALLAAAIVEAAIAGKKIRFLAGNARQISRHLLDVGWIAAGLGIGAKPHVWVERDVRAMIEFDGGGELEILSEIRDLVGFDRKAVVTDHARLRMAPLDPGQHVLDEVGEVNWDRLLNHIERLKKGRRS